MHQILIMIFSLSVLFALALVFRIAQLLYRRFFHLRTFRGPALAAYTRLWLARAYSTEKVNDVFLELNKTYGRSSAWTSCLPGVGGFND